MSRRRTRSVAKGRLVLAGPLAEVKVSLDSRASPTSSGELKAVEDKAHSGTFSTSSRRCLEVIEGVGEPRRRRRAKTL